MDGNVAPVAGYARFAARELLALPDREIRADRRAGWPTT
jgi:hypothetical protein